MRYTISFILNGEDYYYDTNDRDAALTLYFIVREKDVEELEVYDCVEGKFILPAEEN